MSFANGHVVTCRRPGTGLIRWLILLLAFAAPAAAGAQPIVTSGEVESVAVTIYREPGRPPQRAMDLDYLEGFALISETRRVRIPAGESVVRFEGVAAGIVPQSAIVHGFPDGIVERNRDAYLLSPATLLDRSLGRRVHLRRTSRATGEVREQDAEVLTGAGGALVVRTADGVEALRCTGIPEALIYDEVPPGLSSRPTLSVRTRAAAPVEALVTLSYLATGFDWQANYIAELSENGRSLDLFAWLTLGSNDETSFANAQTQAVAGRLNYTEARAEPAEGGPLQLRCWPQGRTHEVPMEEQLRELPGSRARLGRVQTSPMAAVGADENIIVTGTMIAQREELGDLKLYRIPEPVTVAANSQKQVALLQQPDVRVAIVYRARVNPQGDEHRVVRTLVTRNRTQEGLGLPLPGGRIALFVRRQGRPLLLGEGSVGDLSVGDDVEIGFEQSVSVLAETREDEDQDTDGRDEDERDERRLAVTNDQPRPVTFEAEFEVDDDVRFIPERRLGTRDGRPLWRVTVPANGRAILRYRLEEIED